MEPLPDLAAVISAAATQRKLSARSDLGEPGWEFWELRNLNMHRVVGLLERPRPLEDPRELETEIRSAILRNFKRSWWRGLAYGVVVEPAHVSWGADDLKGLVDIYENRKGVLQWIILAESGESHAIGVHSWVEGYLSPVYRAILDALTAAGWRVSRAIRGKDGLLKFLTIVSESKGVRFPEFRDRG